MQPEEKPVELVLPDGGKDRIAKPVKRCPPDLAAWPCSSTEHMIHTPGVISADVEEAGKSRAPDLLPGPWPVVCFARGVSRRIYVDLGGVRLAELMWK